MARLRSAITGQVVSVSDEKAERLGSGWAAVEDDSSGGSDAPAGNASLEAWQDYAKAQGASGEDLDGKTRNELREQYGS